TPKVRGNKITIFANNDSEVKILNSKYGKIISDIYESYGFPPLMLEAEIQTESESSNQDYQKFLEEKQKEDTERARQAVIEMQQQESDKNLNGVSLSGPLM